MKKADLIKVVAEQSTEPGPLVEKNLETFIKQTSKCLVAGKHLSIKHFGQFETHTTPAKVGPAGTIPARRIPAFLGEEFTNEEPEVDGEMVQAVASDCHTDESTSKKILNHLFATLKSTLHRGERVVVEGFGTFESSKIPSRTLIDPDTNESHSSREKHLPHFRCGKDLSVAVAAGQS